MANPIRLSERDVLEGRSEIDSLIERLEIAYPHYTPYPTDSIENIMYRAGQRSVVDALIEQYREDED